MLRGSGALIYALGDRRFVRADAEMVSAHARLCALSDDEFLKALPEAIHWACAATFFLGPEKCQRALSDVGLIHELVHLLTIPGEPMISLAAIRKMFFATIAPRK